MKLSKKMLIIPVVGLASAGALLGAQHAFAVGNSPPVASTSQTSAPVVSATTQAPESSTEAPETAGAAEAPGGHADPAGTNVDHQNNGVE